MQIPSARQPSWTRWVRAVAAVLGLGLLGALLGLIVGVALPTHVEVAGSDARVWLEPGQTVDEFGVTGVVSLRRPTTRQVLGESLAVRAVLDLDVSQFVTTKGAVNGDVFPAYVQAYSDPTALVTDIRNALVLHYVLAAVFGALGMLGVVGSIRGYRRWRRRYDRLNFPDDATRRLALRYRRPERLWLTRGVAVAVLVVGLGAVPSDRSHPPPPAQVVGNPVLADTPLAGIQVGGLLSPVLVAARDYVQTYFGQTDKYYDALRDALDTKLDAEPVDLPSGGDVAQLGFVTDRHCNTGMDRVTVALLKRLGVHTLVSAGDDSFSGTFDFESACTRNLAGQSKRAGITDVMVAGNHDSAKTIASEKAQGMTTLTGEVVTVDGVRFLGLPDPRTSRYGQGILPASDAAQERVVTEQGAKAGAAACDSIAPVIAVLHDPQAGREAIRSGCGNVTLALDGHTHRQDGPNVVSSIDGTLGEQFTGGSAGGAPGQGAVDRTFAASLTVGPLNHNAYVYVVSVDRGTGALVGVTEFRFTPGQEITVTRLDT
ncbi:MAG: hypothetical protein ABI345_00420 [Jatrophihabitans sp.]